MLKSRYTILSLCLLSTSAAFANQPTPSPYTGQEQRDIKALSPDEIKSYLAGKGAGFAKAAEMNHYPGPAHVLELSQQLQLSPEQHARTQRQFKSMQAEAMRLGKALVEQEQLLDTLFASGSISKDTLQSTLENLATLQAQIRQVHLEAHLDQKAILTPDQVRRYDALRGYNKSVNAKAEGGAHHHVH